MVIPCTVGHCFLCNCSINLKNLNKMKAYYFPMYPLLIDVVSVFRIEVNMAAVFFPDCFSCVLVGKAIV